MNRSVSLYLDIVRPLAALVVLLSHVSYMNLSGGQLTFLENAGVQAVDAFFVLSGFVIAHVCATKEKDAYNYFLSRAARIYSVAIPALLLTAIVDTIGMGLDAATYAGPYQPLSGGLIIRSLLFVGEMWNVHRFPGSDGPYWSLGFEIWYYIIFGLFIFTRGTWRWLACAAALVFIGPKVALMFPAWLAGVAAYRFCVGRQLSRKVGWFLFILSFALLAGYQFLPPPPLQPFINFSFSDERLQSTAQDYLLVLCFVTNIIGFTAISESFSGFLARRAKLIRWIAGGTFSIYLMHLPIMHLLSAVTPWPKSSPWTLALLLIVTPIICLGFAEISERRKDLWKKGFVLFSRPIGYLSTPVLAKGTGTSVYKVRLSDVSGDAFIG